MHIDRCFGECGRDFRFAASQIKIASRGQGTGQTEMSRTRLGIMGKGIAEGALSPLEERGPEQALAGLDQSWRLAHRPAGRPRNQKGGRRQQAESSCEANGAPRIHDPTVGAAAGSAQAT